MWLERLFRDQPAEPTLWHPWWTVFSVRLTNGKRSRSVGQLWRRKGPNGWEYKQDAETDNEFDARAW